MFEKKPDLNIVCELGMYSVKDDLAENFSPIFLAKNVQVAKRMVFQGYYKLPSVMGQRLYALGVFNENTGEIDVKGYPVFLETVENILIQFAPKGESDEKK